MLVGRDGELARLRLLIDRARQGESSVVVLTGEPGIGKSSVLAAFSQQAGVRVLAARGVETESDLPYVALGDVFRAVADAVPNLPPRQAQALAGALALGPAAAGDRFAIATATLTLLGALAESGPVLVVVDDAQWIDPFSREALSFAGRRLTAEGVVIAFAARDADLPALGLGGFEVIRLAGLAPAAARALVAAHPAAHRLTPAIVSRIVSESAGNPLALLEFPSLVGDADVIRWPWSPDPLPVGELLNRSYRSVVQALPPATQQALLLVAVLDRPSLPVVAEGLALRGLDPDALSPAEAARVVTSRHEILEFRHPLLRGVIYHGADLASRREAHRVAAALSTAAPDLAERTWHLHQAGEAVDAALLRQLHEQADADLAAHRYARAAHEYRHAAELETDPTLRVVRLMKAADATRLSGRIDAAAELLAQVAGATADPAVRVPAEYARGRLDIWRGRARTGRDALVRLVGAVDATDPAAAVAMLGDAAIASVELGEFRIAEELVQRAGALRSGHPAAELATGVIHAFVLVLQGREREARDLLDTHQLEGLAVDPLARDLVDQLSLVAGLARFALEQPSGRELVTGAVAAARAADAVGVLRSRLAHLTWMEFTGGAWSHALALAHEALLLAELTGGSNVTPLALANLARIEAGLGLAEECRTHAALAREHAAVVGTEPYAGYADFALAFLACGRRDFEGAARSLATVETYARSSGLGDTPLLPWASWSCEVQARLGNRPVALRLLDEITAAHADVRPPTATAIAHRCRALLDPHDFEAHLVRAVAEHARAAVPFETARTELLFGELLRRAGRRTEAKARLSAALAAFESLGAVDWRAQAARELRISGVDVATLSPAGAPRLTPQEMQVAHAVADGRSNREVATQLFLSVKTVEFHLGNVYRKLGVTRRSQVAGSLSATRTGPGRH